MLHFPMPGGWSHQDLGRFSNYLGRWLAPFLTAGYKASEPNSRKLLFQIRNLNLPNK